MTEIAERVGLHKSTVHRFMVNLDAAGLVERNPRSGRYRLGLHIFELGGLVMQQMNLWDEALPFLEGLVRDTGETGHLAVLDGGEAIYIERVEARRRPARALGDRPRLPGPRHQPGQGAAGGPAARAGGRDRRRPRPRVLHPQHDHRPPRSWRSELARIRERGYAIDDEEYDEGLRCIGAGVRDHSGRVVSALGIGGPVTRITPGGSRSWRGW